MSEFVDYGGGFGQQTTEIYLKRVLTGDMETVRARLEAALERLGYDVIEEEPALRGRRGARGWGTWYGSADVLDYAMTLVIRLKPAGPFATRATFDYSIKHPWLSKGEKEVLTREAEAITALATLKAADKMCAACGTESTDDSRFCRRCGAPLVSEQATLDVLRMSAETRAGHTSVVTSTIISLTSLLVTVLTLVAVAVKGTTTVKALALLIALTGIFAFLNFLVGAFAWKRLNGALRLKRDERQTVQLHQEQPISSVEPAALPPPRAGFSVTEGTTELFGGRREKEPVRVEREGRDTDAIN